MIQQQDITFDLTVVTVCRNVGGLVVQTADSVLKQKKTGRIRIEHLFIDGASTDDTPRQLASLLEQGKIEHYVSEPDSGIYNAMNKGIRMARGKVLFFLNIGDVLDDTADLADFVRPIVRNECDATCGQWRTTTHPDCVCGSSFHFYYVATPCCHQAFFLSKAWYEKLGGYQEGGFKCMADGDLMWRAYAQGARVEDVPVPVMLYQDGGFSDNLQVKYLNELVGISHSHMAEIGKLAAQNPSYARALAVQLAMYTLFVPRFARTAGERLRKTVGDLRELCETCMSASSWVNRMVLRLLSGPALRRFVQGKDGGRWSQLFWRIPCLFLSRPAQKRYREDGYPLPLWARLSGGKRKA